MTPDHAERAELKAHAHAAIDAATKELERGSIPRTEWQRRVAEALSAASPRALRSRSSLASPPITLLSDRRVVGAPMSGHLSSL